MYMRYKLNQTYRSNIRDGLWLGFVLLILAIITLYGYEIIAYISTHNVLKGEF